MENFPSNNLFYFDDDTIKEFYSEEISRKSLLKIFTPKIGVVSYKNLFFIRKTYPQNIKKHLKKVIEKELEIIFQGKEYCYNYQIINGDESQFDLTLWAYDGRIRDELIKKNCSYIIPEPLFYSFEKPTLMIYQTQDFYLNISSKNNKILNFMTTKKLSKELMALFLKDFGEMRYVKCYAYVKDEIDLAEFFEESIDIEKKTSPEYPLFVDFVSKEKVKNYWVRKFEFQQIEPYFFLRIMIYLLIALSLNFYMSKSAYDEKIYEIDREIKKLRQGTLESERSSTDRKIEELRQKKHDIVYITDTLSNLLPHGTVIRRILINEDSMEVFLSTLDPLVVLNNLNFEKCFTSIKLASPMTKEADKFNLELKIGLKKCKYQEKN